VRNELFNSIRSATRGQGGDRRAAHRRTHNPASPGRRELIQVTPTSSATSDLAVSYTFPITLTGLDHSAPQPRIPSTSSATSPARCGDVVPNVTISLVKSAARRRRSRSRVASPGERRACHRRPGADPDHDLQHDPDHRANRAHHAFQYQDVDPSSAGARSTTKRDHAQAQVEGVGSSPQVEIGQGIASTSRDRTIDS